MAYFVPIRQSQSFINVDPAYSDSSKMIYVWGRIVGPGRNPGDTIRGVEDAYIYITPSKSSVIDSFGNIYNMIQPIITRTNSLGNWGAYVPISQFLIPETYWTFRGKWPGGGFSTGPIETPNDTTGQLTKDSDGIWAIE